MEAKETTATLDRKDMQAAIKDLNAVLEPKPKLNIIGGANFLADQIVKTITNCIGTDEAGNTIWTNPKAGNLNSGTIAVYELLVEYLPEVKSEDQGANPAAAIQAAEEVYLAENEECPGWVKSAGPTNPKYEAICAVCSRKVACAERSKEEASTRPKTKKSAAVAKPNKTEGEWAVGSTAQVIFELIKNAGDAGITKEDAITKFATMVASGEAKSLNPVGRVSIVFIAAKTRGLVTKEGKLYKAVK